MPEAAGEVIIRHVTAISPASHVRSTLLQSSLASLKARGHYDRYLAALDCRYAETVIATLAPVWVPIEAGLAHYRACDALRLDDAERVAIGESVGDRIQGTFMQTVVKSARAAGVTPWVLLSRFDRFWGRLFQGGSVELVKIGPKDLTIELKALPLIQFEYFRTAFTGVVRAGYKFVGVKVAYVKQAPWRPSADRFVIHAAWV